MKMKLFFYISSLILLTCFSACKRSAYPLAMQQAEKLMNTRPDSALHTLEGMADSLAMLSDEARMYWHLLTIQAKDKQYITHTDDSLINRIVEFYEDEGNDERLMMAYYYQGSTYRDMNDAPRALKAFQQALDLNVPNYDLQAKAYNQMGTLFMYQGLHDEVIRVNRKAIELYLSQGKRNKISYAQRDIARMYDVKNVPDSALHYYQEACRTALEDGDSVRYYGILGELGGYYTDIGESEKAKDLLMKTISTNLILKKNHLYINLSDIYEQNLQFDSAHHYYQKVLNGDDIRQKCYAYYALAWMENRRGNLTQAMMYMNQYIPLKDSIDQITQTESIAKINALYNYQHALEENVNLKIKQEKQQNKNLLFLLILFGVIVFTRIIFLHVKKKSQEELRVARILKEMEEDKYNYSLAAIKENELKIQELANAHRIRDNQNGHLQRELSLLQKEMMELRNREILRVNDDKEERIATFQRSSLHDLLQRAASNDKINLTEENWSRIQSTLDFVYPYFRKHLRELYPQLSALEEQVCWLIKLSIQPAGIARIVKRSNSAISNIRSRLHKKIHKTSGNGEMFDEFIRNL
jgi:tetratricopeptide (TPR) repeat protein